MTTIGFIGSGKIGGTVARLSATAGHSVVVSNSRGPETLSELVATLGPAGRAAAAAEAARAGDLVVVSIPYHANTSLPAADLTGKVVLDTGNYYPDRDGQIARLDDKSVTNSGLLQEELPGARVVKVFNNIFFRHLGSLPRPAGAADRSFLPVAGDDEAAVAAVTAFLDSIGYGTVVAGSLADSWRQEPGTPVYGPPYGTFDDPVGHPASADVIRQALASATR